VGFICGWAWTIIFGRDANRVIRHKLIRSLPLSAGYNTAVSRPFVALIDIYSARELVVPTPDSICTFVFSVSSLEIVKHASTPRNLSTQRESTHARERALAHIVRYSRTHSCARTRCTNSLDLSEGQSTVKISENVSS